MENETDDFTEEEKANFIPGTDIPRDSIQGAIMLGETDKDGEWEIKVTMSNEPIRSNQELIQTFMKELKDNNIADEPPDDENEVSLAEYNNWRNPFIYILDSCIQRRMLGNNLNEQDKKGPVENIPEYLMTTLAFFQKY